MTVSLIKQNSNQMKMEWANIQIPFNDFSRHIEEEMFQINLNLESEEYSTNWNSNCR